MTDIDVKVGTNSTLVLKKKADGIPAWYPNDVANKAKWWYDGSLDTDYFWAKNFHDANVYDVFIQYGQNVSQWAACRHFIQSFRLTEQHQNDDGSIYVKGNILPILFGSHITDFAAAGVRVQYKITIGSTTVWTLDGNTTDQWMKDSTISIPIETTVAPQETYLGTALTIEIKYPDHEFTDSKTTIGLALYNPTPPTYKPMAMKRGGQYVELNQTAGHIEIKQAGEWVDKSGESVGTIRQSNTGHNRIKIEGVYIQLPPMKGGTAQ